MVILQALTAFFAVVGLFETAWQILLLFTRRSVRGKRTQIIIETDESTDPAFLLEDLRLLENRLTACRKPRVWLICPKGAKQETVCRYVAERNETVRVVSPQRLKEEIDAFVNEL